MKINHIQYSTSIKNYLFFKAGVTNLYSDFDGTFMPYEYRHDIFCMDGCNERKKFLLYRKSKFQSYFDGFKSFIEKAKGKNGDKFNFTITTGRNRPEYNYYVKRIRQDGLSVPLPDKLVIRNGGDIYVKRQDIPDFFKSHEDEVFLKKDVIQEKRDAVKKATNGWDGEKFRNIITNALSNMTSDKDRLSNACVLWEYIKDSFPETTNALVRAQEEYDKIITSDMSKDEIRIYIQKLANKLKEKVELNPDLKEQYGSANDIDWHIGEFADKLDKIKKNRPTVFEADTENFPYEYGMSIKDKLEMMTPRPNNFVALKENGNLEFHINFPYQLDGLDTLEIIEENLSKKLEEGGVLISSKIYKAKSANKFNEIFFSPLVDGSKINKLFDTKAEVQRIMENGLNDLVIAAGDDSNDVRMLNLFEYIEDKGVTEVFDENNLKKIYNLPLISIFVNNSQAKSIDVLRSSDFGIPYDKIDDYFNSDGNVRFIQVIPDNNIGKPQTLQEGVQLAIREYAKRNEEFRNQLPEEIQTLVKDMTYEYPIDRDISKRLETELGVKLWNPAQSLKKDVIQQKADVSNNAKNIKKIGIVGIVTYTIVIIGALITRRINEHKLNSYKVPYERKPDPVDNRVFPPKDERTGKNQAPFKKGEKYHVDEKYSQEGASYARQIIEEIKDSRLINNDNVKNILNKIHKKNAYSFIVAFNREQNLGGLNKEIFDISDLFNKLTFKDTLHVMKALVGQAKECGLGESQECKDLESSIKLWERTVKDEDPNSAERNVADNLINSLLKKMHDYIE